MRQFRTSSILIFHSYVGLLNQCTLLGLLHIVLENVHLFFKQTNGGI